MIRPDEPAGRVDMAAVMLRAAREDARSRGAASHRVQKARPAPRRRHNAVPVPLAQVLLNLFERRSPMPYLAPMSALWQDRVGPDLAKHVVVTAYDAAEGVLSVRADSVAWATQTRLLAPRLVGVLNEDFVQAGVGPVRTMRIAGRQPMPMAYVETETSHAVTSRPLPRQMYWMPRAFTPRFGPVVDQAVDDAVSRQAAQAERKSRDRLDCQRARTALASERDDASDSMWEAALRRARTEKASAPTPPPGP